MCNNIINFMENNSKMELENSIKNRNNFNNIKNDYYNYKDNNCKMYRENVSEYVLRKIKENKIA